MVRELPLAKFKELPLGLRQTVKELWEHPDPDERSKAVDELVKAYLKPVYADDKQLIIKHVISAFKDETQRVREKAKSTLAWKLELDALQQLTETMKTSDLDVKKLSAEALSTIRKRLLTSGKAPEIKRPVQQPLHYALAQFDPVENPKAFLRLVEDLQKPDYANKNPEWWDYYANQLKNKYRKTQKAD